MEKRPPANRSGLAPRLALIVALAAGSACSNIVEVGDSTDTSDSGEMDAHLLFEDVASSADDVGPATDAAAYDVGAAVADADPGGDAALAELPGPADAKDVPEGETDSPAGDAAPDPIEDVGSDAPFGPGDRDDGSDAGDDAAPDLPDAGPVDADAAPTQECVAALDCDDEDACTIDLCDEGGQCEHLAVVCDDGSPCTHDSCSSEDGCVFLVDDALACDDGLDCTTDEHCAGGQCVATPCQCESDAACVGKIVVGDCAKPVCVFGQCSVGVDEAQDGAPCDDGLGCTEGSICAGGVCSGGEPTDCSWVVTSDCESGWCDPAIQQCVPVPAVDDTACDDGSVCTVHDRCTAGLCGGDPVGCDDGEPCNGFEGCHPVMGCTSGTPLPCDDGDACNGLETCTPGAGCKFGTPLECDDGDACNGTEGCDPATGCVDGPAPACDDLNFCNGVEVCSSEAGGCVYEDPPQCDDGLPCNGVESCEPAVGCVDGAPIPCDDGEACNGVEGCDDVSGGCVAGPPLVCSDGDPCNGLETCDESGGCVDGPAPQCGWFTCDAGGCATSCGTSNDCVLGGWCDPTSAQCVALAGDGAACSDPHACASSSCTNGFCCAVGGTCCASALDCPKEFDAVSQEQTTYFASTAEGPLAVAFIDQTFWAAQSFPAGITGPASRVELMLSGTPGVSVPMEVQLWSGNLPTLPGAKLVDTATFTVTHDVAGVPKVYDAEFPEAPEVQAGGFYLFVVRATGPAVPCGSPCNTPISWYGAASNPFVFGLGFRSSDAGESYTMTTTGEDFYFRFFVGLKSCVDHQCQAGLAP